MKFFLDPEKPLKTCQEQSCDNCNVKEELNCHFNYDQLIKFLISVFPAILVGGIGIYFYSPLFLIPWLVMFYLTSVLLKYGLCVPIAPIMLKLKQKP